MAILSLPIIEPHPTTQSHREVNVTRSRAGLQGYIYFYVGGTIAGDSILDRSASIVRAGSSRAFSIRESNGDGF